mmetsp:Transcript_1501/g.4346  ORF Transcript_1501/g.4346 Transcript_1501/m.4346 type:complete len:430 (-) Transcript_1501:148-1437(-)
MSTSILARPAGLAVGRQSGIARPPRTAVVVGAEGQGPRRDSVAVARRQALFSTIFTGLTLTSTTAKAREPLPELPEPKAPRSKEALTALEKVSLPVAVPMPATAKAPAIQAPTLPSAVDPLVLGGAAAVALVAAAGISITSMPADKADAALAAKAAAKPEGKRGKTDQLKEELKKAEEELQLRESELEKLRRELAAAKAAMTPASAAKEAALEALKSASEKARASDAEVASSLAAVAKAQAQVDKLSTMGPLEKILSSMAGTNLKAASAQLDAANDACSSASSEAMSSNIADRQAWIAHWRAATELLAANASVSVKLAEVSAAASAVVEVRRSIARLGEPSIEERVQDRQAWIAAYKARSLAQPAAEEQAVEGTLEARVQDRQLWIAAYRARSAAAGASQEVDETEARVADRRAWISAWRERVGEVVNA